MPLNFMVTINHSSSVEMKIEREERRKLTPSALEYFSQTTVLALALVREVGEPSRLST